MIDHRSQASLETLCRRLHSLTQRQKNAMAAFVVNEGLMYPKGLGDRLLYYVVLFTSKMSKVSFEQRFYEALNRTDMGSEYGLALIEQTIDWILNGQDQTDKSSYGGYNSDELSILASGLDTVEAHQ